MPINKQASHYIMHGKGLEKQIVFRAKRLIRVRRFKWVFSIFDDPPATNSNEMCNSLLKKLRALPRLEERP